jgi:hypothetical protein
MNENTEIDEEQCLSDWKSHNLSCDESIRIHDYCERAFRHAWKLKQGEVDLYKNKLKNTQSYSCQLNNIAQDLLFMEKLRLFAKKDIKVVESFIKAGQEVRIGKISQSQSKFMLICAEDNLHKWCEMSEYEELVEDRIIYDEYKY